MDYELEDCLNKCIAAAKSISRRKVYRWGRRRQEECVDFVVDFVIDRIVSKINSGDHENEKAFRYVPTLVDYAIRYYLKSINRGRIKFSSSMVRLCGYCDDGREDEQGIVAISDDDPFDEIMSDEMSYLMESAISKLSQDEQEAVRKKMEGEAIFVGDHSKQTSHNIYKRALSKLRYMDETVKAFGIIE